MNNDDPVTSPTPAPAETGDAKVGNLSLDRAAQHLLRLSQQREEKQEQAPVKEPVDSPVVDETPQAEQPETEEVAEETTIQESEGQPEAAPEPEHAEDEPEDVLSQLSSLDPKAQEVAKQLLDKQKERLVGKFEKRIGKEVAKKKSIESQIQTLSQQLEEMKQQPKEVAAAPATPPPLANPNNPLSGINDIQTLNNEFMKAKEAMRTSEDLLAQMEDNGMDTIEYGGQQFTRQSIKAAMRNAKRVVEDHAPAQAQYLQARQNSMTQANDMFPWLKNKNSTEYVMAQRFLSDPTLSIRADRDIVAGLLVEGYRAIEARNNAKATTKPSTPKPKAPASQAEFSASSGATRAPDSEIQRARAASEVQKLATKKGGLKVADAARMLLHQEKLLSKRN